jgi:hypothetical protein
MKKQDDGYIVVETLLSFIMFLFFALSLLSLINIVTVNMRMHYAVTQVTNELSMYSYLVDVVGATDELVAFKEAGGKLDAEINTFKDNIRNTVDSTTEAGKRTKEIIDNPSTFKDNLSTITDLLESAIGSGEAVVDKAEDMYENPEYYINLLLDKVLDGAVDYIVANHIIKPMMEKYLENGDTTADTYLNANNIGTDIEPYNYDTLDFDTRFFMNKNGDIIVTVTYDIDYTFGFLPLDFTKLSFTQSAKTRAWIGEDTEI